MSKIKKNLAIVGIIYAIISCFIFSIMNALVKAVATRISSNEIVFFRSIIGMIMILYFMKKEKVSLSKTGISMLALRGCCGAFYMVCYFYAIANMPLVDAVIIINMSPFFTVILSRIFLKEKVSGKVYLLMIVAFIGVMFIINPLKYSTFSVVAILAIMAAVFDAAADICIRYLGQKYHTYEIIFYFMIMATIVSIPLMWNQFAIPNFKELLFLICIGVVSLLAQIFLTKAFTYENAIIVDAVRYIGIVFNAFWGLIFWKETPDGFSIIGIVLIVGSCIRMTRIKKK